MIRQEIRLQRKGVLLWSLGFVFMILAGMTKMILLVEQGEKGLHQMVEAIPRTIRVIYGMEGYDLSSATGYFGLILFYILLMVAFQGIFMGNSLLNREQKEKTTEFLFVKPMPRSGILGRKYLGGLLLILWMNLVIALSYAYELHSIQEEGLMVKGILITFVTHLFFYSLGFFISVLWPNPAVSQRVSLLIVLFCYSLVILSDLYSLSWLEPFSIIGYLPKKLDQSNMSLVILVLLSFFGVVAGLKRIGSLDLGA